MEICFFSASLQSFWAFNYATQHPICQRRWGSAKTCSLWPVLQWSGYESILPHHQQRVSVTQHLLSTVIISRLVVVKICVNCCFAYICWGWSVHMHAFSLSTCKCMCTYWHEAHACTNDSWWLFGKHLFYIHLPFRFTISFTAWKFHISVLLIIITKSKTQDLHNLHSWTDSVI